MTHLVNHAANGRRVFTLDDLLQAAQSETADSLPHVIGTADKAPGPLDLERASGFAGFSEIMAQVGEK